MVQQPITKEKLIKDGFEESGQGVYVKKTTLGYEIQLQCTNCRMWSKEKLRFKALPKQLEGKCAFCEMDYGKIMKDGRTQ